MSRDASNAMDISATLDELLKDDEMFNELQDLPLNVGTQAGQCESQDLSSFDLSFLFSDLNGDISEGMWSTEPSDLGTHHGTSSEYIQLTPQSDSVSRESKPQQTTSSDAYNYFNQWVGEEAQNVCTRAGTTSSVSETTPEQQQRPEVTTLAAVRHDHSYAKLPCSEEEEKDVMEVEEGSDSAEDSSSNHDAGYETMSASMSPDSKSSPPPPLSSASLSLLPDPVKLIDERIKYFMSTQQVSLSAEEKETLIAEGLPVPTTLPLTKIEEKALKSVRRKIRNKVAAQESRKKKKEYIDSLEERVKRCSEQNHQLQRKVDNLETENRTLLQQLQQLQALVARTNPIFRPMQLGSCLMVVVLCFAILFGNMLPYKVTLSSSTEYTSTATVRSRALLSLDTPHYHGWIDYYKSLLLGDDTPWSMLGSNSMVDQSDEYSKTELDTNKTNEPHPQLITAR